MNTLCSNPDLNAQMRNRMLKLEQVLLAGLDILQLIGREYPSKRLVGGVKC